MKEIRRAWNLGRLELTYSQRSKRSWMGRFGGGWDWKVGIQAGGRTVIISLLVCSLIISWRKP